MEYSSFPKNLVSNLPIMSIVTTLLLLAALPVNAGHTLNLSGSDFEIESNANLTVENTTPPALDWVNVNQSRKIDAPSDSSDNFFTQDSKEDTLDPAINFGSIPPNQSDLKEFGIFEEVTAAQQFVHLYWTRAQDPRGTTYVDFEFNQSTQPSANGVTTARTQGDLLIEYNLSRDASVPQLYRYSWLTGSEGINCEAGNAYPCWGDKTDLTSAGDAAGMINASAIIAGDSDGIGALEPRTFGEASMVKSVFGNGKDECFAFASAYVKSRSANAFTSAPRDFIAPTPVDIRNCGKVTIFNTLKELSSDVISPFEGVLFTLFEDEINIGTLDQPSDTVASDTVNGKSCTTALAEGAATCMITDLLPGAYCLKETLPADETRNIETEQPACLMIGEEEEEIIHIENTLEPGTA